MLYIWQVWLYSVSLVKSSAHFGLLNGTFISLALCDTDLSRWGGCYPIISYSLKQAFGEVAIEICTGPLIWHMNTLYTL